MSNVKLNQAVKCYGSTEIIHGIDLTVEAGEFCAIVGPSGCGKSTLLRMIAGLESTSSGTIHIGEQDVTQADPAERGVAMVFQTYALYPHMTVKENMSFGLRMNKVPKKEIETRVNKAADILQLEPYLNRKPKALSGGQRQRVAIGRAIVRDPKVFLFDEPLSNLDAELRVDMRIELSHLHKKLNSTMIYVTHDQVEAMTLANKIVVLREGRIEQVGSPLELYQNPDNKFVAGFIGSPSMNFFKARVDEANQIIVPALGDLTLSTQTSEHQQHYEVWVGLRPQDIQAKHCTANAKKDSVFSVDVVEQLGGVSYLYVNTPTQEKMIVEMRGKRPFKMGDACDIKLLTNDVMLFDISTGVRLR